MGCARQVPEFTCPPRFTVILHSQNGIKSFNPGGCTNLKTNCLTHYGQFQIDHSLFSTPSEESAVYWVACKSLLSYSYYSPCLLCIITGGTVACLPLSFYLLGPCLFKRALSGTRGTVLQHDLVGHCGISSTASELIPSGPKR